MKKLDGNVSAELTIKKSKFIANIFVVKNEKEAIEKINEVSKKYFDAKHNCYAYRVYENNQVIEKFSDNGEPSGTAGLPMLDILKGQDLINVVSIVTRYFGGILLGTGGLVKAYSDTTKEALKEAKIFEVEFGNTYSISINYDEVKTFENICESNKIKILSTNYEENVEIIFETIPKKVEIVKSKFYNNTKIELINENVLIEKL